MGTRNLARGKGVRASAAAAAAIGFALVGSAHAQNATNYQGNGATGFGGPVGLGSLAVSSDGAGNITFTLNLGTEYNPDGSVAHPPTIDSNAVAIYIGTATNPGLSSTASLTDTGTPPGSDYGHVSISGYDNFNTNAGFSATNPERSLVTFPTGFTPSYALSFADDYDGLFSLPTDGSGNLGYVTGAAPQVPGGGTYPLNTLTIPLTDIGATQGQQIYFVATLIDGSSAYRSNETFADATIGGAPLPTSGNPGFNTEVDFTDFDMFNTAPVPEPASLTVLGMSGLLLRRRKH